MTCRCCAQVAKNPNLVSAMLRAAGLDPNAVLSGVAYAM
jgi:hypothetical protein